MWYVYILTCNDKRSYVGCTSDLKDRLIRHRKGKAFDFEKYLKTEVGRVFLKKRIFS